MVVETHSGEAYVGQLDFEHGQVVVYNGFVGRPPTIPAGEVERITPADEHPDVVEL